MENRGVIRCLQCGLNQFLTTNGDCRKCGNPFYYRSSPPESIKPPSVQLMTERPTWGTMLSQVRKSKGLSQSQLARKIGVPRTYISKIEISSAVPTVRSLLRFAAALKVQVEYLIPPEFSQSSLDFACEIYELAKDLNADQRHLILYFICSLSKGQMPFLEWETIPATDLKEPNYAAKTREVAQGRQ